jgi:hypothetical protein
MMLCFGISWIVLAPAAQAADIPHGRDCATATDAKLGTELKTTFANAADRAVYRIVLDARGLLDVALVAGESNVGNTELLDSSCVPVQLAAGVSLISGKVSALTIPSPLWTLSPAVYFVKFHPVSAVKPGSSFNFTITFTRHYGHNCATAEPLSANGNTFASAKGEFLYSEDRQVFRIVINEPGRIHAWTEGPLIAPNQPYVDLLFDDCSSGAEFQALDSTEMGIVTSMLQPGIYYFAIIPEPHSLGRYTLRVELQGPDIL